MPNLTNLCDRLIITQDVTSVVIMSLCVNVRRIRDKSWADFREIFATAGLEQRRLLGMIWTITSV